MVLRALQTCLSLWERCRAATERAGSLLEGAGLPPCGKTEGVLQIGKIRMRFALTRTCQRAALSVICFANASSPKGRAEKPVRAAHLTHQADSHADLPACCSFRHGLRRATFLSEEGFGFPRSPTCLSLRERCRAATERACISYFPSQAYLTRICPRAALSVICFANASSPKGRAKKPVRTAHLTHQADSHADLSARCSFRHGLRRATFLREEGFGFPRSPTCLSLWERCRAATERAGSLFEGAGFAAGKD